jgi:hypothetical protein
MVMDYNKICQPPHYNQSRQLADEIRLYNIKHTIITPIMLLKRNIKQEADEKNIIIDINSMVNTVWDHHLTNAQREKFENLAKSINEINQNVANVNNEMHDRMIRINNHQEIDNAFGVAIFSGTNWVK